MHDPTYDKLLWSVVLGMLLIAPTARGDAPRARALLEQGVTQFGLARFDASLRSLEQARAATKDPQVLARVQLYIGLNRSARDDPRAREAFVLALTHDPTLRPDPATIKPDLVRRFDAVLGSLRGELSVQCNRPGALVTVGGQKRGAVPLTLRLPVGRHRVEVQDKDGKFSAAREVLVRPGGKARLKLRLGGDTRPRRADAPRPPRRVWTWVATGATAVALAVGVGLGVSAGSTYDDWKAANAAHDPRVLELQQSVQDKDLAANVMFGVAGALAVTSVVLFLLEGRAAPAERASIGRWSSTPLAGAGGGVMIQF